MKTKERKNVINRFEKVVLIIVAGLGAGVWGFGLLLALAVPYEYGYPALKWFLTVAEQIIEVSIFLFFQLAIINGWIKGRRNVWLLFFIVLASSILVHSAFFFLA
ncbi:MAG: hypothetical protein ACYCXF_05145 [Thermoleophilia bacterium]